MEHTIPSIVTCLYDSSESTPRHLLIMHLLHLAQSLAYNRTEKMFDKCMSGLQMPNTVVVSGESFIDMPGFRWKKKKKKNLY